VGNTEGNSGEIREPVIVVSDLHIDGKSSHCDDFRDFLEWLNTLSDEGTSLNCNGNKVDIKKPGTIVLLGDILELWDPEEDDRNYVISDVLTTISILNSIDCDIIYVIGNHDEDLLDLKKVWRKKGVEHINNGKGTFKLFYRSYPKTNKRTEIKGITIGEKKYAFLHGHQFDRFQVFYKLSRFLSIKLNKQVRIDPIDWFQDLANVSFTKNIGLKLNGPTLIFCILLVLYGLVGYYWFKDTPIGSGLGILWIVISSFFVLTILPKVVTFLNTEIWRRIPGTIVKKCKPIEEVIKNRYNAKKGGKIDADIIVFGHTHNAGYYQKEPKKDEKMFINTGCWVKLSKNCIEKEKATPNTFLYIDTEALYLLKWNEEVKEEEEKNITCVKDFREVLSQ
jgi:UDP-2,3-diacylglucosamine pyrophosphatase LpxH